MNENRILNWKKGPKDSRDFKSVRRLSAPVELPDNFELDKQIPIYDQGNIGSCTSNSACSCFRYEVAQLAGNFDFNPSRLFQYYNTRKLQGWEGEDSGGYIRDAFKSMNKWGLAKEALWPYKDTVDALIKEPSANVYEDGLNAVAVKYAAVPQNERAIKETLLSGAAVSFGFNVYQSFYGSWSNSTGLMPVPKRGEELLGGHAVTIIGWKPGYFLIQNSWGMNWGIGGKFWQPYSFVLNSNECDDFWCIEEVKIAGTEPVPPKPSEIDWNVVSGILFKTAKELYAVKKPTIIRLGLALGLEVNEKKNFAYNFNLVKEKLGL